MKKNSPWVSATDIASWTFCPESWRLGRGLQLNPNNPDRLRQGTIQHARWQLIERGTALLIQLGFSMLLLALAGLAFWIIAGRVPWLFFSF